MLKKYQTKYNDFVNYVDKTIIKNKVISHAYLMVGQINEETKELVKDFSKIILCPNKEEDCQECNICELIDANNYSELMIIEPDGSMIKKEQLINLQSNFINKPINSKYRVYIIFGADKLNDSSGNSILKFLEDPMEGIIAILVCENYLNVLKTIVSRCQVINLLNNKHDKDIDLKDGSVIEVLSFLNKFEENHEESIAFVNELLTDFSDKSLLEKRIDIMIKIYQYVLDYKLNRTDQYYEELKIITENNDINSVVKKMKVLCDIKSNMKYNVNINLLMDKLIIGMSTC